MLLRPTLCPPAKARTSRRRTTWTRRRQITSTRRRRIRKYRRCIRGQCHRRCRRTQEVEFQQSPRRFQRRHRRLKFRLEKRRKLTYFFSIDDELFNLVLVIEWLSSCCLQNKFAYEGCLQKKIDAIKRVVQLILSLFHIFVEEQSLIPGLCCKWASFCSVLFFLRDIL